MFRIDQKILEMGEERLIAEAPLPKEWVESTLEKKFGHRPKVTKARVLNEVIGYMSLIVRVDLDWTTNHTEKHLPQHILAKIPNTQNADSAFEGIEGNDNEMRRKSMIEFQKTIHHTEIDVYEMFERHRGNYTQVSVPTYYGSCPIDSPHPVILMDYIDNSTTKDLVDGFSEDELLKICDEIAALHVYSFETEEWKTVGKEHRDAMPQEMQESMDAMFRGMIGSLRGRNRKELTRCVELIEDHIFKRPDWIELDFMKYDKNQEGAVFNHCDLWSPQILWRNGEISGIVDWAMVRPHSLNDYIDSLTYICITTAFAVGMWSNSNVLRDGKSDEQRIAELEDRLIDLVRETSKHHNWEF
ncbi:hypothetical protein WR25_20649 [Diploscapter pachys]|uniref:CHK kinase-like domain-containing protein n=1 Tax=Diploscapter pachys TaxID=2018661 RepID=A0A2A2L2I9_9BILA|nr:hypothetical protein WR25_20649 [Diploscapter pachys]